MSLWSEIRRRNVHRVAIGYVAAAWLLVQVAETVFPLFGYGDGPARLVVIILAVGFVPALILSWIFEWTPEGLQRDDEVTAPASPNATRRFDAAIIAILVLAVAYFAVDKFVFDPARDSAREAEVAAEARGDAIRQQYGEHSIAVLAFEDISEDGDLGYFADGISEELLNLLAKIPELRVAGRTSAFSFKGSKETIPEIAKSLGVAYIVEGSIRTAADRIRITVQLIEASSDTHLFSQNYDREFGDIFDIQDEVAAKVVDELQISLLGDLPHVKRVDPRAYALYLQARTMLNDNFRDPDVRARIETLLSRAIELDPDYSEALALAARHPWTLGLGDLSPNQRQMRIRQLFSRVLAINPNDGNALNWMAWSALVHDKDIETAARFKKRAHESDPTNYEVLWTSLATLPFYGKADLAAKIGDYLVERDPLCIWCYENIALTHMQLGNFDTARARLQDALDMSPESDPIRETLAEVHLFAGEPEKAEEIHAAIYAKHDWISPGYLGALHDLGQHEKFDELLPKFVEKTKNRPLVAAQMYAWIGYKDEAFRLLELGGPDDHWAIRSHLGRPWYREMHDDPRWRALLEEYQMTPEVLASLDLDFPLPPGVD